MPARSQTRRTIVEGAAWSVPVLAVGAPAAHAGISQCTVTGSVTLGPVGRALPNRPSAAESPEGRGRIVRADVVDGIRDGSEGLVLVGESPVHLGPLALTLWYAAGPRATDAMLLDAARLIHGDHPGAERAVGPAVDHLVEVGVLRRT